MTKGPKESFVSDCKKTSTGFEYDNELSFDENMLRYRSYLTNFEKKILILLDKVNIGGHLVLVFYMVL